MQIVLNQLVDKSHEANLTFSPEKTVAMAFSQKKKNLNKTLHRRHKIKDSRVNKISRSNYRQLIKLNSSHKPKNRPMQHTFTTITRKTSSYLGPKPKLMRWVYTGIIRPKLTYGALVWAHNLSTKQHGKLKQLNRIAYMSLTPTCLLYTSPSPRD